jgi:hypothetical protein
MIQQRIKIMNLLELSVVEVFLDGEVFLNCEIFSCVSQNHVLSNEIIVINIVLCV